MEKRYDVFISYSTEDQKIAEGVCGYLERNGYRCFVAYRDIPRGIVWAAAITEAIDESVMMVVVFSKYFNISPQTDREIELASENKMPILTYRIADDKMTGAKKYYLKNLHWIDAFPNPEKFFGQLLDSVRKLMGVRVIDDKEKTLSDIGLLSKSDCYFDAQPETFTKNEENWDKLLDLVMNQKIIPVIGADMLTDDSRNVHMQLLDAIIERCHLDKSIKTFDDLSRRDGGHFFDIHYEIHHILEYEWDVDRPNSYIVKLLETLEFPFVITTSFFPIIEKLMMSIWGNAKLNTIINGSCDENDISRFKRNSDSFCNPTILYIYGKYNSNADYYIKNYAITNEDKVDFCKRWIFSNNSIDEYISKHNLLFLGHSINETEFLLWKGMQNQSFMQEKEFLQFLDNLSKACTCYPEIVISELISRIERKRMQYDNDCSDGVFILFSPKDYPVATILARRLKAYRIKICCDKNFINDTKKISCSKIALVLISNSALDIENGQLKDVCDEMVRLKNSNGLVIIPVFVDDGVNRNAKFETIIPHEIRELTGLCYWSQDLDIQIDNLIEFTIQS